MTTESAFATAEESVNSTGYEVNTEDVDGKNKYLSLFFFYSWVLPPST